MKYFYKDNDVYAFELDGSQDFLITSEFVKLTDEEVKKHCAEKETEFHTKWDGEKWIDCRTKHEIQEYNRSMMPNITKRQLQLYLLDADLLDYLESSIKNIEDSKLRRRVEIEYSTSTEFVRNNNVVKIIADIIGWTDDEIDEMWRNAALL